MCGRAGRGRSTESKHVVGRLEHARARKEGHLHEAVVPCAGRGQARVGRGSTSAPARKYARCSQRRQGKRTPRSSSRSFQPYATTVEGLPWLQQRSRCCGRLWHITLVQQAAQELHACSNSHALVHSAVEVPYTAMPYTSGAGACTCVALCVLTRPRRASWSARSSGVVSVVYALRTSMNASSAALCNSGFDLSAGRALVIGASVVKGTGTGQHPKARSLRPTPRGVRGGRWAHNACALPFRGRLRPD